MADSEHECYQLEFPCYQLCGPDTGEPEPNDPSRYIRTGGDRRVSCKVRQCWVWWCCLLLLYCLLLSLLLRMIRVATPTVFGPSSEACEPCGGSGGKRPSVVGILRSFYNRQICSADGT